MDFLPFSSESYAEHDRPEAWRDVLRTVGLQPASAPSLYSGHATASRRDARGVTLAKLAAGSQVVAPLAGNGETALPTVLIAIEDGVVLRSRGHEIVPAGHLLLLPRKDDWTLQFQRDMRAIVLHVTSDAFHGRKTGRGGWMEARAIVPHGFADLFARTLDAAGGSMDTLSDAEWGAAAQSLADLLFTLTQQYPNPVAENSSATRAAILNRVCQKIEGQLDDPALTPARVAQAEGISERYLQKLFEGADDNFTHYVRERRLQHARADLGNPAEAPRTISEIAYRYGFADSAHFSRTFRHRFGVSPREFRHQQAERVANTLSVIGHRGWPQDALAQLRHQPCVGGTAKATAASSISFRGESVKAPASHHLAINAERVHWGFFSRSLPPQAEIRSGDTITIETLTQHASDDPERMIAGDPAAEAIFRWTPEIKTIDRRGAGPMDASVYGRGAGEGFGVHICTGPIAVRDALPGDVLEVRIVDIAPRASRNPQFSGRVFGSSVAAWWGYHYNEFLVEPKPREVVTIYEMFFDDAEPHARAIYSFRWTIPACRSCRTEQGGAMMCSMAFVFHFGRISA
jgi:AraC-like DNA-binding protein